MTRVNTDVYDMNDCIISAYRCDFVCCCSWHSIDQIVCVYVVMGMWFMRIVYACTRICS